MSETRFRVGAGIGMVAENVLALFEPMNAVLAEEIAALLASHVGIDDVLELISSRGLRSLGSFTLVQFEESGTRVVVRGSGQVVVSGPDGDRVMTAAGVRTWLEEVTELGDRVALSLGPFEHGVSPFRISAGVVPADMLIREAGVGPRIAAADVAEIEPLQPDELFLVQPVAQASSQSADVPDIGRTMTAFEFEVQVADGLEHVPLQRAAPVTAEGNEYDDLYGHTVARSVQAAAVGSNEPDVAPPEQESAHSTAWSAPLIQGVPASGAEALGDHDGRTISKAQLNALREQPLAPPPPMGGPTVQAVMCSGGHPNPPAVPQCRVCSAPVSGTVTMVSRPVLGVLDFVGGTQCRVDRPILVGRNPKVEGTFGGELPQLVKLDVGQGLSRTHAVVRIEGWQVLLEDLNSANGTIVTLPGREPRRLHPGEPVLLEPNSHVDFGGEVACVFR